MHYCGISYVDNPHIHLSSDIFGVVSTHELTINNYIMTIAPFLDKLYLYFMHELMPLANPNHNCKIFASGIWLSYTCSFHSSYGA